MNPPGSDRLKGARFSLMIVFTLTVVAMMIAPAIVSGASGPKQVRGYVWDSAGRDVEGADVTVNIRDPDIRATLSDTTDATGYYSVTFGPSDWDIGDTIEVIATYLSNQETNSTSANSNPFQWVNVTYTFEIPEFGSIVGFLVAGSLLGIVATVFLVRKRK